MPSLPYVLDSCRVQFGGTTGVSAQTWSSGFSVEFGIGTDPTQSQIDTWAASVQSIVDARMGTLSSRWDPTTNYSMFKVTFFAGGILLPTFVSTPAVGGAVGSGTRTLPGFCALVASLRSSNPMRTGRGRMYLPATAVTLTADGETDSAACTAFSTNMANMLTSVNALTVPFSGMSGACAVQSHKTGLSSIITHVIVDSKIDVQHRRTDKLGPDVVHSTNV